MRKFLSYLFLPLLYILLIVFFLISLKDANQHPLFFIISMMIEGVFIALITFFFNKSKRIETRRFYLLAMSFIAVCLLVIGALFIFYDKLVNSTVFYWVFHFSFAIYASFIIFQGVYTFKYFFKKGYSIEKLDFYSFEMLLNSLSFGGITYLIGSKIISICASTHYDTVTYKPIYNFQFDSFLWPIVYISIAYLVIYIVLSIIYYVKFEKKGL